MIRSWERIGKGAQRSSGNGRRGKLIGCAAVAGRKRLGRARDRRGRKKKVACCWGPTGQGNEERAPCVGEKEIES